MDFCVFIGDIESRAVAHPGFVPSHFLVLSHQKAVEWNSSRVCVRKLPPHFLARETNERTSVPPARFSQISELLKMKERLQGRLDPWKSVSVSMPPPFAMAGEEVFTSSCLKTRRGRRRLLFLFIHSLAASNSTKITLLETILVFWLVVNIFLKPTIICSRGVTIEEGIMIR